ncbi:MAG: hypothetical protein KDA79_15725 [Planctomycetaceae bacterium]|nr:hypothetical protein [Planctomycetaceae bacterium]
MRGQSQLVPLMLLVDNVPAEGLVFCPMATGLAAGYFVSLWHSRSAQ